MRNIQNVIVLFLPIVVLIIFCINVPVLIILFAFPISGFVSYMTLTKTMFNLKYKILLISIIIILFDVCIKLFHSFEPEDKLGPPVYSSFLVLGYFITTFVLLIVGLIKHRTLVVKNWVFIIAGIVMMVVYLSISQTFNTLGNCSPTTDVVDSQKTKRFLFTVNLNDSFLIDCMQLRAKSAWIENQERIDYEGISPCYNRTGKRILVIKPEFLDSDAEKWKIYYRENHNYGEGQLLSSINLIFPDSASIACIIFYKIENNLPIDTTIIKLNGH